MITISELYKNYNKIVIWGGGGKFEKTYDGVLRFDYIVDSDEKKWGTEIKGLTIYSPKKLLSEEYTVAIIICSNYWEEIVEQIKCMNCPSRVFLPDMLEPNPFSSAGYYKKSFALFAEDGIIEGLSSRYNINIKHYIDIGANHPLAGNATALFYLKGATGCLIEPNGEYTKMLRMFRPKDKVLHMGISDDNAAGGELDYYKIDGLVWRNTFSAEVAEKYRMMGYTISKEKVMVESLNNIIKKYDKKIQYISIDVEGLEWYVLKDFEFEKHNVEIFNIEKGDENVRELMHTKGYVIVAETLSNWIFLKDGLVCEI